MTALPFLAIFGTAACLMATAFIVMPRREQRKLREDLIARIEREPEKIQTVFLYLDKEMRTRVGVKFRGEGRVNLPGLTGVPATHLHERLCALAPQAEQVDEPVKSPEPYFDVPRSPGS